MRLIDAEYTRHPFYGSRNLRLYLTEQGYPVNRKRVQRLMHVMGIESLAPQKKTSQSAPGHPVYPYLLRDLSIDHSDQVWCTDITYLPMPSGFMYLVAIMDWYSRYVLSWELSNTLDADFCVAALQKALDGRQPEIFNSDQGAQFTAQAFTQCLQQAHVQISMDGRGRFIDNIFIERLWRSLKYEEIYLHNHDTVPQLSHGLEHYFHFYNEERPHQGLGNRRPQEVYFEGQIHPN